MVPFLPHLITRSHLIYLQQLGISTWPLNSYFHNVRRWWHCSRLLQMPLQQHTPTHLLRERTVSSSEKYFSCYTASNIKLQTTIKDQSYGLLGLLGTKHPVYQRSRPHTKPAHCEIVCPTLSPKEYFWDLVGILTQEEESLWPAKPHLPPTVCTAKSVYKTSKAIAL